ncbi:hypothetical protein EYF80_040845 [Liparis tanakae]|uniref:Uncharacterized protein n=1 Tax=Liparis tanakae TaxID=230148 RepID=A0A4Z2G755_9TELE|nr:hypothetical protein EYF80_040845 [Liparis tanakae]
MRAVLSPMNALVTLAMMLELFRGRPSARYTFTKKRAQGRSEGGSQHGARGYLVARRDQEILRITRAIEKLDDFVQKDFFIGKEIKHEILAGGREGTIRDVDDPVGVPPGTERVQKPNLHCENAPRCEDADITATPSSSDVTVNKDL